MIIVMWLRCLEPSVFAPPAPPLLFQPCPALGFSTARLPCLQDWLRDEHPVAYSKCQ